VIASWFEHERRRWRFWMNGGPEVTRRLSLPPPEIRHRIEGQVSGENERARWLWGRCSNESFEILTKNSRRRGYGLPLKGTLSGAGGETVIVAHFEPHPAVRIIAQVWLVTSLAIGVAAATLALLVAMRNRAVDSGLLLFAIPPIFAALPLGSIRSAVADAERVAKWFDEEFNNGVDPGGKLIPGELAKR
jgi:hypothetical protein